MHPMAQTDTHTDGHRKSKTESAQWADTVKSSLYILIVQFGLAFLENLSCFV